MLQSKRCRDGSFQSRCPNRSALCWSRRDLSSNALTGTIPASWSDGFHSLQMLDLHGNQLSGALPDSFGTAGALPSLNNLVLNNNQFSGESIYPPDRSRCYQVLAEDIPWQLMSVTQS